MTTEPIFETIARGKPREPLHITVARRFVRKLAAHGIAVAPAIHFRNAHLILVTATRSIRVDSDGVISQTAADPHGRANANRAHAQYLKLAARFRGRGQWIIARAALGHCLAYRAEPATEAA